MSGISSTFTVNGAVVALEPDASCTVRLYGPNVPTEAGLPETLPVAASRARPGGGAEGESDHVAGGMAEYSGADGVIAIAVILSPTYSD